MYDYNRNFISEVEMKVNRFLAINRVQKIIEVVNLSDEQYVAMAIYYEA
jgi:hypothetical protein